MHFLVNSICGPFSKGQQNPEGRRGAGWQALANGAAMLALGYPAVVPAARPRKKLEEIVAYDGWRSWPPWGSRFFLRRLGLISERDDVQKFFGKKTKKRLL